MPLPLESPAKSLLHSPPSCLQALRDLVILAAAAAAAAAAVALAVVASARSRIGVLAGLCPGVQRGLLHGLLQRELAQLILFVELVAGASRAQARLLALLEGHVLEREVVVGGVILGMRAAGRII
eukprot:scaffold43813_cov55-Phaeocystis_antarctica.AAC.2